MKNSAEYEAFKDILGRVLSVPREEIQRREAEYKRKSEANPRKRGPKRKVKPSASPGSAA
jgi:hypothetical protein